MTKTLTLAATVLPLVLAGTAQAEYIKLSPDLTIHYKTAGAGETTILSVSGCTMGTKAFAKQFAAVEGSDEYRFAVTRDGEAGGGSGVLGPPGSPVLAW